MGTGSVKNAVAARILDTPWVGTYHPGAILSGQRRRGRRRLPSARRGSMRNTVRSVAILVAVLLALTGGGVAPPGWAAGERDITLAQGIDAEFLDVQMTNNIVTLIINTSIYDTLLTRDKQLQLVPNLATSYRLVSDRVWEVKLRQNVKFHNGEPFDANAVKFSFERINRADFKSPQKGWFGTIERVEVVDPSTVRFHTKVPDPAMPARMSLMYQLPPKYVTQVGDAQANLKPVGTGPFKFVEWQKNERIVVEANDAHWSGKPAVRRATWKPIPELGARIAELPDHLLRHRPDQGRADRGPPRAAGVELRGRHAGDPRRGPPRQRQAHQLLDAAERVGLRSEHPLLRVQSEEGQGAARGGGPVEPHSDLAGSERAVGDGQGHRASGRRPAHRERYQDQHQDHRRVGRLRPDHSRSQDRGHRHGWVVPAEPRARPLGHPEPPHRGGGLPILEPRGRQADGAGPLRDERREAKAALQPAPARDPRRGAVHLRVPADGHLRRQLAAQVDAQGRRVDPAHGDQLLALSMRPLILPSPPPGEEGVAAPSPLRGEGQGEGRPSQSPPWGEGR